MKFDSFDDDHQVVKHVMSFDQGGIAEMAWKQPKCTCGWAGDKIYAYDNGLTIQDQYREHYYEERNK